MAGTYGSLKITVLDHPIVDFVRVYPTFVHLIKNYRNSRLDERVTLFSSAKRRWTTLTEIFKTASGCTAFAWDGALRVEIRFKSCTLKQALALAPRLFRTITSTIGTEFLSKENWIDRVVVVHTRAQRDQVLRRRGELPVTKDALTALACLANAVGFSNWQIMLDAGIVSHRKFPWQTHAAFDMFDSMRGAAPGSWFDLSHRYLPPNSMVGAVPNSPFMQAEFRRAASRAAERALDNERERNDLEQQLPPAAVGGVVPRPVVAAADVVPPQPRLAVQAAAAAPARRRRRVDSAAVQDSDDELPKPLTRAKVKGRQRLLREVAKWLQTVPNRRSGLLGAVANMGVACWRPTVELLASEVARKYGHAWRATFKTRVQARNISGMKLKWAQSAVR